MSYNVIGSSPHKKREEYKVRQLRNYTEEAVKLCLDKWYHEADICQCDDCRLDVMAIMLNNLPPQYIVTEQGAMYAQLSDFNPQYKADLITNMGLAVNIVKNRSRHERTRLPMVDKQGREKQISG